MNSTRTSIIRDRYLKVLDQIEQAAKSAGRDPTSVKLVTVTKGHSTEDVMAAYEAGIRRFGENYLEEASDKIKALGQASDLEWHMIGHVQSRKAKQVSEHFHYIHSIDSLHLAQRIDRFCAEADRKLPVFLECNVSGESSKFGWQAWKEDEWETLIPEFSRLVELDNITVCGLMTMAPFFDDPEPSRPYFERLRHLRDYLNDKFPLADMAELSMGMSGDFTTAVKEGATWLRIGTAIMGRR